MRPLLLHAHTRPLTYVIFNHDGDLLFTAGKDNKVGLFYAKTGERIGSFEGHNGVVWGCDVTFDSSNLVTASADMKVFIWDVETGERIWELEEGGPCKFVQWCRKPDPQTKFLVVVDSFAKSEKCINIYSSESRDSCPKKVLSIKGYTPKCLSAHWGAFDETIISVHEDGRYIVWDAKTSEKLWEQEEAHKGYITCANFTNDRCIMLTTGADQTAKLWDMVGRKLVKTYTTDRPLNSGVISPLVPPGDQKGKKARFHDLLGGGQSAEQVTTTSAGEGKFQALIYHAVYGDYLGSVKGHFSPINTLAFLPDGSGFASGAEEGYVRLHVFDDDYWSAAYD
jgi:translation initiation factor 3 subunit I